MKASKTSIWVVAILAGVIARVVVAAADTTVPPALQGVGIAQRLNEQVPLDLMFTDETGQSVRLGQYFGKKPVILVPAYYECPMLCTLVLNGLVDALKLLSFDVGKELEVVTFSFDANETPAQAAKKKAAYINDYGRAGAAEGWHFLTGSAQSIERLTQAIGYQYKYLPEEKQFAHAAGITVLTPQGRISRYFYGVELSARDLRFGLIESAAERIGSPVDQLLLYCFHYDPTTGKYGMVAMGAVRIGGILTVLALAGFVIVALRRERNPPVADPRPPAPDTQLTGMQT